MSGRSRGCAARSARALRRAGMGGAVRGRRPARRVGRGWFDTRLQRPLRAEVDRYGVRIAPAPSFASARWHTGGALRSGFPVPPEAGGDLERVIVAINPAGRAWTPETNEDVSVAEWLARLAPDPATRDFVYGWSVDGRRRHGRHAGLDAARPGRGDGDGLCALFRPRGGVRRRHERAHGCHRRGPGLSGRA